MLKIAGHVKKHYKACCIVFEDFKNRNGVKATFEEFLRFVEQWAEKNFPPEGDERDCFRGDMLEILAEIFFKAFENSPTVGLRDYTPVPLPEDYGMDGQGVNAAGNPCAVQVKYRGDPKDSVTYAEIARTYTSARLQKNLVLDKDDTIFVFTTAFDMTVACKTVFDKKLRVLNRETIAQMIDNNVSFWQHAFDEIKNTLIP